MQIDANNEYFKNIAPLISRLNKQQNHVEDEQDAASVGTDTVCWWLGANECVFAFQVDEDEDGDGRGDDDLINDILSSDEEEEQKKREKKTVRKNKLVPLGEVDDADQEELRSLSFREREQRTKKVASRASKQTVWRPDEPSEDRIEADHRKNVRRAPRGRMTGRRRDT